MVRRKKRKLPKSIEIGGHTIRIELDDTLGDRGESYGQWHGSCNLIVIDPRYGEETTSETFLHEVIEAINGKTEMGLTHPQIQTIALLLHQALISGRG